MEDTKERILLTSLELFSSRGFDAVSVRDVAVETKLVKSALYKHFKDKRDIFDSIVKRMEETDFIRAAEYGMPQDVYERSKNEYLTLTSEQIVNFTKAQFSFWVKDDFASRFRKLLVIEQYKDENAAKLLNNYLLFGPLEYTADLFRGFEKDKGEREKLARRFYLPVFSLYFAYDLSENKEKIFEILESHLKDFIEMLDESKKENKNEIRT